MKVNQQFLEMKLCIPNWYSHVYVFHQVYKIIIMIIKSHFSILPQGRTVSKILEQMLAH